MKNNKHIFIPLFILVGACLLGLIYSIIDFTVINKNMSYSYEVIQFDYDGASDGVDPNGNPFNPIGFLTDEIISDALNESGLSNKYSIEKVRQYIVIENIVPENIVDEITSYVSVVGDSSATRDITSSSYHSVRYRFILYRDMDKRISTSNLNNLLSNIVDSYCEHFYLIYKNAFDTTSYNTIYTMENYDYIYQVEVFTNKINILKNTAKSLYSKHDDFMYNNKNFNDISLKCDQLVNSDVSRINNIITLNALSKDVDRLKEFYNYKISTLTYSRTKYTTDLANINTQLANYTKDSTVYVGSGENIIKVESNSNDTYNKLLAKKIDISNQIASINSEINDYQAILNDINNGVATEDDYNLARGYITKLGNDYDSLEEIYKEMMEAYNDKYIVNGTISRSGVSFYSTSIVSLAFVKRCILICAPIILSIIVGVSIYYIARETKKKAANI